jgi:hypothetical protein
VLFKAPQRKQKKGNLLSYQRSFFACVIFCGAFEKRVWIFAVVF